MPPWLVPLLPWLPFAPALAVLGYAVIDYRGEKIRKRKTTPEGSFEHPAEIWWNGRDRLNEIRERLKKYRACKAETVFDEVNHREDKTVDVIKRTESALKAQSEQLTTITRLPLAVEEHKYLGRLDDAASDKLKEPTRAAKRNLNGVWGVILFAAIARGFQWPKTEQDAIEVFGLSFHAGLGLTTALSLLIGYHAWQFWSYLYADTRSFRAAYDDVQRYLAYSRQVIDIVPKEYQWPSNAEATEWIARSKADLVKAERLCRPARHRYIVDFKVPKYGALVTLCVLWGMQIHRWLNP